MGRFGRAPAGLAVAAAVLLGACGPLRRQPATGPAAPAALQTFAADAADLVSSAGSRNWSAVSVQLAGLEQAWTALRPAAAGRGASAGLLDAVDSAVTAVAGRADALSVRGTQTAANRVTAFVPDLMVLWPSAAPPQLAEMAYLARAVQLDVQAGRTSPLWTEARTLATQWAYVRAGAQARDSGDASQMDSELTVLGSAVSAALSGGGTAVARPASAAPSPGSASAASSGSAGGAVTAASSVLAPSASAAGPARSASAAAPSSSRRSSLSSTASTQGAGAGSAPKPAASPSTGPVAAAAASILQTLGALQRAYGGG